MIKVVDLAWLEFDKPTLATAERFAIDFGFVIASRTETTLDLRGARAGTACVKLRIGRPSRFTGLAFAAASVSDLDRLAAANVTTVAPLLDGGFEVVLRDPSGITVRVVAGVPVLPALDGQAPLRWNIGQDVHRANATQRAPREPARVERLGHVVLESPVVQRCFDWYLHQLGLIVSDFMYFDGQRERGPIMAFIRCDRGAIPTDHHTLAIVIGPTAGYVHSAYQVADLDAIAAGGEYLKAHGYRHAWGIGRHVEGSQIFDYWRDPDQLLFEHFADGDMFDSSMIAGWTPMRASGLSQWGPPVTADFLDAKPTPRKVGQVIRALRDRSNELDLARMRGLLKVVSS